jgi:hypothetical protein
MEEGWIIIFEGNDNFRYPSAVVHKTFNDAQAALDRRDQEGAPLKIIKICWDDSGASQRWR